MKATGKNTSSLLKQLGRLFRNREYRHSYAESFTNTLIAAQLKANRESRQLSQEKLAALAGMKQSQICRIEDINYESWSVRTLRRIANALDLVLVVRFESFGAVVREMESFNRTNLEKPSFADDPAFKKNPPRTMTLKIRRSLPASIQTGFAHNAPGKSEQSYQMPPFTGNMGSLNFFSGETSRGKAN